MGPSFPEIDDWGDGHTNGGGFTTVNPSADDWGEDTGGNWDDTGADATAGDNASGGGGGACHNCGQEGHFSKECPEPRKMTGECFNCGEVGHNKKDCTNATVDRPFTGTCKLCGEQGHRRNDCPQKPPPLCKNCRTEGHNTEDCTEKRVFTFDSEPIDPDAAWDLLLIADREKDLAEFRRLLWEYGRGAGNISMVDVENALRDVGANYFLVALDKEIPDNMTNVDICGNINKKYALQIHTSYAPRRKKFAQGFPSGKDENEERLKNAGFTLDKLVMMCHRCGEIGHTVKACKQEREGFTKEGPKCALCSSEEHLTRACPEPRKKANKGCRNCGEEGHVKADCPNPTNMDLVTCKECEQTGHFARECPNKPCRECNETGHQARECPNRKITCRNCNEEGHMSRECTKCKNCLEEGHGFRDCTKARDWSRFTCPNCGEKGHGRPRCPKPEDSGMDGFGGDVAPRAGDTIDSYGGAAGAAAHNESAWDDKDNGAPVNSGWNAGEVAAGDW